MPSLTLAEFTSNGKNRPIARIISKNKHRNGQLVYLNTKLKHEKNDIELITSEDGDTFFPYLETSKELNIRISIVSRSGGGKSYFAGQLLDDLVKRYKKDIIIFSFVDHDPALDRKRNGKMPERVDLNNMKIVDMPIDEVIDKLENSFTIFDDIEVGYNKEITKWVFKLRSALLMRGRHKNIDIISVSHVLLDGAQSKLLHVEETGIVLFPRFNAKAQLRRFLDTYIGMNKDQIDRLMKIESRAVYISNVSPPYYIAENEIGLID